MGYWDVGPFDNSAAREVVDALRCGHFNFDQFAFDCAAEGKLDAELGAGIVALLALIDDSYPLPADIDRKVLASLDLPRVSAWLKRQRHRVLDPKSSGLYDFWSESEQIQDWLDATAPIGQPRMRRLYNR